MRCRPDDEEVEPDGDVDGEEVNTLKCLSLHTTKAHRADPMSAAAKAGLIEPAEVREGKRQQAEDRRNTAKGPPRTPTRSVSPPERAHPGGRHRLQQAQLHSRR